MRRNLKDLDFTLVAALWKCLAQPGTRHERAAIEGVQPGRQPADRRRSGFFPSVYQARKCLTERAGLVTFEVLVRFHFHAANFQNAA